MSYPLVATAQADAALNAQCALALQRKAYSRIDNVADLEDQREHHACVAAFRGAIPTVWVTMVLLRLEALGTLATATDAEVDTAVTDAWTRIRLAS